MQRNPIVLLTRGASAAVGAALHAAGVRTVTAEPRATRASGSSPRGPRSRRGAPSLKRPRTPEDFAAIRRAELKRWRKGAKLRRDFSRAHTGSVIALEAILLHAARAQEDARVRTEALSVARELETEAAA